MDDEILCRVQMILASLLRDIPRESLVPEAHLVDDLAVDSMFMVESAVAIEEEFRIEVPEEDIGNFHTIGDIVEYIKGKVTP
jgi:acyl carrier protein